MCLPCFIDGGYMISQIKLINCQSWRDVTINLAKDKLNVLIAENNTGKSVLFKILKISACSSVYDREDQKSLISWGADYASAIYVCDEERYVIVQIFPNKVIYRYKQGMDSQWESTLYPTQKILDALDLLSNDAEKFIVNIIDTDQSLLLVKKNLKANLDLISFIVANENLDNLDLRTSELQKEFRSYEVRVHSHVEYLQTVVNDIKYVDTYDLEKSISVCRAAIDTFRVLSRVTNLLQTLHPMLEFARDYDSLLSTFDVLQSLEDVELNNLVVRGHDYDLSSLHVLEKLETVEDSLSLVAIKGNNLSSDFVSVLQELESINLSQVFLNSRDKNFSNLEDITDSLYVLDTAFEQLMRYKQTIKMLGIYDCGSEQSFNTLTDVFSLFDCLQDADIELSKLKSSLDNIDIVKHTIDEIKTLLKDNYEVLQCPIHGEVVFDGDNCIPYRD